jgi:DNA replication protein DnaC
VEHQAILITGMTGTGKSYLACALAHQACRKGYRAMYRRAARFFDELKLARADGTYPTLLAPDFGCRHSELLDSEPQQAVLGVAW